MQPAVQVAARPEPVEQLAPAVAGAVLPERAVVAVVQLALAVEPVQPPRPAQAEQLQTPRPELLLRELLCFRMRIQRLSARKQAARLRMKLPQVRPLPAQAV